MKNNLKLATRYLENKLNEILKGYSCLLIGPRQTGNTTWWKEFYLVLSNTLIAERVEPNGDLLG